MQKHTLNFVVRKKLKLMIGYCSLSTVALNNNIAYKTLEMWQRRYNLFPAFNISANRYVYNVEHCTTIINLLTEYRNIKGVLMRDMKTALVLNEKSYVKMWKGACNIEQVA